MTIENSNNITIIGADVAKDKLDLYFYESKQSQTIGNDEKNLKKLLQQLSKLETKPMLVMESTGGYELLAWKLFSKAGYPVHIAHPNRIHHFAKQKGVFAKNDRIDAKIIAMYAEQERVTATAEISEESAELKGLSTRRSQLIEELTAEKNRLKPHLNTQVKRSVKRMIKCIETEIKIVEKQLDELIGKDNELKEKVERLKTFNGVGITTARALICNLPELGHLTRAQIACLIGLAPKTKDSGTKIGKRVIQGGRFYARKALYMAALSGIRFNQPLRDYYNRLKKMGKHSKVALTAVMRKIIITLNAMLRDKKDWKVA